jgi:hypothetical protein
MLVAAGSPKGLLSGDSYVRDDYGWSGHVMLNVLAAMEQVGLILGADLPGDIDTDEDSGVVYLATRADVEVMESLDLDGLDEETIGDGLGLDDAELREAIGETVAVLYQLIAGTKSDEVLVIRMS